jgi:hypothetical protein
MRKYLLLILFLTAAILAKSQDVKINEPEFTGTIVYVNDNVGNGMDLETTNTSVKSKATASVYLIGVGKFKTKLSVRGKTSTVRIKQSNVLQFVYRATENTVNPKDVIQLIPFKTKGKHRVSEVGFVGTFSGTTSGDIKLIEFTGKKYQTSSYLITVTNLSKGEYGFSLGKEPTSTIHMFTVE